MQVLGDNELSVSQDNKSKKIVIIEDNQALAEIYKTRLELIGYTCYIGYNGITGLFFVQEETPDLILLDLMIPDISGAEALAILRRSAWGRNIKVVVISNLNESEAAPTLRDLGIEGYFVKANMTDDQIDIIVNDILRPGWRMAKETDSPADEPVAEQAGATADEPAADSTDDSQPPAGNSQ